MVSLTQSLKGVIITVAPLNKLAEMWNDTKKKRILTYCQRKRKC